MFPNVMSICPFSAAVIELLNSCSKVPIPTLVMPMISVGTPSECEITAAP